MEERPSWETNSRSADHEISGPVWYQNAHYSVQKIPSMVHILSLMNPVHIHIPYSLKIYF